MKPQHGRILKTAWQTKNGSSPLQQYLWDNSVHRVRCAIPPKKQSTLLHCSGPPSTESKA